MTTAPDVRISTDTIGTTRFYLESVRCGYSKMEMEAARSPRGGDAVTPEVHVPETIEAVCRFA